MNKAGSKSASMDSINSIISKGSSKSSTENLSTNFKARPASVLYKKPFIPAASDKEPTIPEPICLQTERRRLNRLAFEEEHRQKKQMLQRYDRQREELKKAAEKEEIARIRKMVETKATPMPKYTGMVIQPSTKKLTVPKSPTNHLKIYRKTSKENVSSN